MDDTLPNPWVVFCGIQITYFECILGNHMNYFGLLQQNSSAEKN